MTHEIAPSPDQHEEEPFVPRKLFNIENFTPADVEQFVIAIGRTSQAAFDTWARDRTQPRPYGVDSNVLNEIGGIFEQELRRLPAIDLEKAEAVFAQLATSEQILSRETAADSIDSLAEHQAAAGSDQLQRTIDLWCRMMAPGNNNNDVDSVISEAAQQSAARAVEAGRLALPERQRLYEALEAEYNVSGMAKPS